MIFINSFKWQQTLWATQNSKTLYIVPIIQSTWNHLWHLLTLALPSVLWRCWLGSRKGIRPVKNWAVGCWRVICLQWGADLHNSQLMPLPLTVSCFSKIQTGFTFLVPAHLGSPGKRAIKRMCVCVLTNKNKKHLLLIVNYKIVKTWKLSISPSNLQELTTREEGLWHHSGWRDMAKIMPV